MNNQYNQVKAATSGFVLPSRIGLSSTLLTHSLPSFLYFYYLMDTNSDKNFALRSMPDYILNDAIKCSNTKELKTTLLKIKRDKIFNNNVGHRNSIIINEIIGIYDFLRRAKQYCWSTARIYLDT